MKKQRVKYGAGQTVEKRGVKSGLSPYRTTLIMNERNINQIYNSLKRVNLHNISTIRG